MRTTEYRGRVSIPIKSGTFLRENKLPNACFERYSLFFVTCHRCVFAGALRSGEIALSVIASH